MLNSRQRAQLRGLANSIEPIFQIGKSGIGEHLPQEINNALEVRELIKITVLETSPKKVRECADEVAAITNSDVVQVIGSKFILYKESRENKKIILVK